ncbi:50S ribosomal protein L31 [Candidatus Hepatoplasma crinochetorum]|jgi:large subunit ribosomal protein L31|uniref:Large ribosomal subunit protein bL31 n=1 Tax=Candidatus Hepatoplasma crinochetorum Av TaxID=1427984 RepID=W8GNM3_9MOLU|nr:50S ribosomal protein L31 [Candidatus Hepatoplasma crinochetorum]AHK22626.1 50S ribosomal protein L31 [Candidatus Hepatoplasma crinochetorum Av]BDV03208.1 MAG: 50S ribosomal protein L31 [Candidatus Hepatoplasma crinochetorum]
MKENFHPTYHTILVKCATCGTEFKVNSTKEELHIDVCSKCHPFYTGKMGANTKAGRIDKFNKRALQQKK